MGGSNNARDSFQDLVKNFNLALLDKLAGEKTVVILGVPKQERTSEEACIYLDKCLQDATKQYKKLHFLSLRDFGFDDWVPGKHPHKSLFTEKARGKLANMVKYIIDTNFDSSVKCIMEGQKEDNELRVNIVSDKNRLTILGKVNGHDTALQLDTGADVCVATSEYVNPLNINVSNRKILRNADGSLLEVIGSSVVQVELQNGEIIPIEMQIIKHRKGKVLLGYPFIEQNGLESLLPAAVLQVLLKGEKN